MMTYATCIGLAFLGSTDAFPYADALICYPRESPIAAVFVEHDGRGRCGRCGEATGFRTGYPFPGNQRFSAHWCNGCSPDPLGKAFAYHLTALIDVSTQTLKTMDPYLNHRKVHKDHIDAIKHLDSLRATLQASLHFE